MSTFTGTGLAISPRIARLISWTPADGYETQTVQPGPNPSVQVKFRAWSGKTRSADTWTSGAWSGKTWRTCERVAAEE
jgi:hypothetical protein